MPRKESDTTKETRQEGVPDNLWHAIIRFLWPPRGWRLVVLSCLLLLAGFYLVWQALPDERKESVLRSFFQTNDKQLALSYYPGIEVEQLQITLDLARWKADTPLEIWETSSTCRKTREEANYLARRIATSADQEPEMYSSTHSLKLEPVSDSNPRRYKMKNYDVLLDISKEKLDVPFVANIRSVRHSGVKDPTREWAGNLISQSTREFTFKILFPPDKHARNLTFSAYAFYDRTTERSYVPETKDTSIVGTPNDCVSIAWHFRFPRLNYAYEIHWEW
jgi:hypothetical protein